jgi:hypothetical protein
MSLLKINKYSLLKTAAYTCGLPVIGAYALAKSLPIFQENSTYRPYVLAGFFVFLLVTVLYIAATAITGAVVYKKKTVTVARVCTAVTVALSVLFTTGIWFIIDKALPPVINGATQNMLTYDDLKDDYATHSVYHSELLKGFIEMNIENGRLSPEKADIYRTEGYGNDEVEQLIENSYNSLMLDGYDSFNGMLVTLAGGERLTVPVLIHLLFDERDAPSHDFNGYTGEGRGEDNKNKPVGWSILDMQEGIMTFSVDLSFLTTGDYADLINFIIPTLFAEDGMVEQLIAGVEGAVADEDLLGSPIYIGVNYAENTITLSLTPSSTSRGVYDYKNMAYLANNNLLIAAISLFPIRDAFYLLGAFLAVSSLAVGIVREKQYVKKEEADNGESKETA